MKGTGTRLVIESVSVRKFKSGPKEGEYRSFFLPDDAQIVKVTFLFDLMFVYYARPA